MNSYNCKEFRMFKDQIEYQMQHENNSSYEYAFNNLFKSEHFKNVTPEKLEEIRGMLIDMYEQYQQDQLEYACFGNPSEEW